MDSIIKNRYPCCHLGGRLSLEHKAVKRECPKCHRRYHVTIGVSEYLSGRLGETTWAAEWSLVSTADERREQAMEGIR